MANPATQIQCLQNMKINELLILNHIHGLPVTINDTQQPKISTDLKSSLMQHYFLFQPYQVFFDPIHPGDVHCCTIARHVKVLNEIWPSTLIDVVKQKLS